MCFRNDMLHYFFEQRIALVYNKMLLQNRDTDNCTAIISCSDEKINISERKIKEEN